MFGAVLQTVRLFGGEVGNAFMQTFVRKSERMESYPGGAARRERQGRCSALACSPANSVLGVALRTSRASVLVDLARRFRAITGKRLQQAYGMSECSCSVLPMPGHDDDPDGATGFPLPEDERGYAHVVDRLKEMIIASGYNVFPRTVEEAILHHEAVADTTVIGAPHAYQGETVKAFVVPRSGCTLNLEDLQAFLKEQLSPVEYPGPGACSHPVNARDGRPGGHLLPVPGRARRSTRAVYHAARVSSPMSSTAALCVSQPTEIRSTPVAATAGAVSGLMRPDASVMARPATIATPCASIGGAMLSSSTASTPNAIASAS